MFFDAMGNVFSNVFSPCPADPASHPCLYDSFLTGCLDWRSEKGMSWGIKTKPNSLTNQRLLGINAANVKLYLIQNKEVDKYLWNI